MSIAQEQRGTVEMDAALWKQAVLTINDKLYRQCPEALHSRISAATALALDPQKVTVRDGIWYVAAGKSGWYQVQDETCQCKDFTTGQAPDSWCKHRLAANIVVSALALDHEEYAPQDPATVGQPRPTAASEEAPHDEEAIGRIPRQFITVIRGKPFVQYVGLLAMAHERGLTQLHARFLSVTPHLALAEATATFQDGSVYSEAADATPENVNKGVSQHFARCALTRAKARALRDALNIALCAVEEVD